MKYVIFVIACLTCYSTFSQTTPLKGVTFGVGIGGFLLLKAPEEYALSTDVNHNLQIQKWNKAGIVISSVISIKFGRLALQTQSNGPTLRTVLVSTNRTAAVPVAGPGFKATMVPPVGGAITTNQPPRFGERLALNISLNLAEVSNDNISFNKAIEGGIGLGYYCNEFAQIAILAEAIRVRQLREYIKNNYEGKPIPNGNEFFNALDEKNNDLFTSKYFGGIAIKLILTVGNK